MIDASVRRADKVIVQTGWMKDAVIKKTGISPDMIVKILPDVVIPDDAADGKRETLDNNVINNNVIHNRFFYPAGEILYKNHGLILEAVGILIKRGMSDFEISFTLNEGDLPYLNGYPRYEQVKYLGRISREEVFERYRKEILLFPSYIETFGYPPAEARAVGGRILASDCPFCHEVLEGYEGVKYFDPFKAEELADLMEKAVGDKLFPEGIEEKTGSCNATTGWGEVLKVIHDG
jgi:glycosyltransferase involved in cell wall biosynthesis